MVWNADYKKNVKNTINAINITLFAEIINKKMSKGKVRLITKKMRVVRIKVNLWYLHLRVRETIFSI